MTTPMTPQTTLISKLVERDREIFRRWVASDASALTRTFWRAVTLFGGASFTIAAALLTAIAGQGALREAGIKAAAALAATHLVAQILKRTITRPRPSGLSFEALIDAPDQFSFPSGHAIAASSLAFVYAWQFPTLAPALLVVATLVAVSRVRLGVHYPGDVIAGQAIAFAGALAVQVLW